MVELKMIDYQEFICALKSSWIKRLLHSDAKWTKLIEIYKRLVEERTRFYL